MAQSPEIVWVWCAPRSLSTVLEKSLAQHSRVARVFHEPVAQVYYRDRGTLHPAQVADRSVLDTVARVAAAARASAPRLVVVKELAYAFRDCWENCAAEEKQRLRDFFGSDRVRHVVLLRDPEKCLASLERQMHRVYGAALNAEALAEEVARCHGFADLEWVVGWITDTCRAQPLVVDMDVLVSTRASTQYELARLCRHMGLVAEDAMMRWPAGPLPEWDVWAAAGWHDEASGSTGFEHKPLAHGAAAGARGGGEHMGPAAFGRLHSRALPSYWRLRTWVHRQPDSTAPR